MAQNKRQHWVPQFYLRYFSTAETRSTDNPQIWATPCEVDGGDVFKVGVGKIAARAFLYSPLTEEGNRDNRVDQRLQDIESLMAQVWPRLATEHYYMGESFRKGMSLFLATLLLRNPAAEEIVRKSHHAMVEQIDSLPKDAEGNPIGEYFLVNGKELRLDLSDWKRAKDAKDTDHHRQFVENIERSAMRIAKLILAKKPWWVCFAKEPVFATSDHPVVCWNEANKIPGVGRPDTVIYFPISPTRILVIGDGMKEDNTANPLVPGGEGFFNQHVYRAAKRWLFTCDEPSPLLENMAIHLSCLNGETPPEVALQRVLRPEDL